MAQANKARKSKNADNGVVFEEPYQKHISQQVRNPNFDCSKRDESPRKVYPEGERLTGPAAGHARNLKWLRLAAKCSVGGILHPHKLLFWVCNDATAERF